MQARALDHWPDGSIRWALLDFSARPRRGATVAIVPAAPATYAGTAPTLARADGDRITLIAGKTQLAIGGREFPLQWVSADGREMLNASRSGVFVERAQRPVAATWRTPTIEENGPRRAAIVMTGTISLGHQRLDVVLRVHAYAETPAVKIELTVRNPHAAVHKGGYWELGDPGSVLVSGLELRLDLASANASSSTAPTVSCSEQIGRPHTRWGLPFSLDQFGSGGEAWQSRVHLTRDGAIAASARGYRITGAPAEASGDRATPIVQVTQGRDCLGVAIEQFWQNWPMAIGVEDTALRVKLLPARPDLPHEIQGGEQKTWSLWLAAGIDVAAVLEAARTPSRAVADPQWVAATGAIPFLTPRAADPHAAYSTLVDSAIEGDDSFFVKRETIDEYGWRHFGEVWADHEAVFHTGEHRLVSHYNNQYDVIAGCAFQYLRSGDLRWWTLMDDLAHHVTDIDIYHTDDDWPKYNHGLFWHTVHYIDAGLSTHRTYPRAPRVYGGGPSCGHLYTTGLMLHHFLTGSAASRDAAIELATFVIDSDDGAKSIFKWIDRGPTGFATASGTADYHGPGRAPGNALNALVDGHRLTGDEKFLRKADEVIRRCIHPRDDIAARDLLDAENKWFYTMFLQSVGKYLLHKRERAQLDAMFAYARASLLAYADWMAAHERPFLETPEKLEFPTETWAAQDMRKSEVFKWAALEAAGEARGRLLERSRFFFDYVVRTLPGMKTRTLARPVVLLLAFGWAHAGFAVLPVYQGHESLAGVDFGAPTVFVPQKTRAMKRAKLLLALGGVASIALASALVWWMF